MSAKRDQIFGMEPWMFWLLLASFIFAVCGPEIAMAIRIESQPLAAHEGKK